jgi:rod shape-determining protein MreC
VALVAASVALMTIDHRQHHLKDLRAALGILVYPIEGLASLPATSRQWLAESLATRRQLEEENASLKAQQLVLQVQLQKLEALETENMRLRELLDSSIRVAERVLVAEIMSVDLAPFSRQVVINKGTLSGVYEGQPLLDAKGVIGQIISVNPLTSNAMLISDPSHAIPVAVNRNGLRAIAIGTGTANNLDIAYLPNNADIQEGDLLVTSGLGGNFPPSYPVAKITQVERNPSKPFARVVAEATASLDRSREVLLVWRNDITGARKEDCAPNTRDCNRSEAAAPAADAR